MNEGLMSFLPFIIIFILFYFMLIRPQMKQAKDHRSMVSALKKGDEVAKTVEIKIQKQTIQTLLPKGTIKSI